MNVIPDANVGTLLTAMLLKLGTAVTGLTHLHLYTNDLTPTKTSVLGDFTELTNVEVPGYATGSVNWFAGVPFRRQDGVWESPSSLADPHFTATGTVPAPIVVYGFFATDSTDAILLGAGRFTSPFTFMAVGDGFVLPGNPSLNQADDLTLLFTFADLQPE
jgi:hypothetical protein